MSIGSIVRAAAGPFERSLCSSYRAFFINVERCTNYISQAIPPGAEVIDVGGGDGEVLNHLLRRRHDISVSMLDLRNEIGMFLEPSVRERVALYPGTSLASYMSAGGALADVILVSDVIHHVPTGLRDGFLRDCSALLKTSGILIVKDVSPGGFVSMASVLADRYITGDRHVSLLHPNELVDLVESHGLKSMATLLPETEHPNYAISFKARCNIAAGPT